MKIFSYSTCLFLTIALVSGCSVLRPQQPAPFLPATDTDPLTTAALLPLIQRYPPAHTHFYIVIPLAPYQSVFVNKLREQGYAVLETTVLRPQDPSTKGKLLHFTVHRLDTATYVLKIVVDDRTLSRLYQRRGYQLMASSYWTQQESMNGQK